MACRLLGAKPLSEPMMSYCLVDPWVLFHLNSNRNKTIFIEENEFENVVCKMATILSGPQCVNENTQWLLIGRQQIWHPQRNQGLVSISDKAFHFKISQISKPQDLYLEMYDR